MCGSDVWGTDGTIIDILSYEVAVNLNMLRPHMERSITGDKGSSHVIAVHLQRPFWREAKLGEKRA